MMLADTEAQVLQGESGYLPIVGALALVWAGARWRTSWIAASVAGPEFDEAPADHAVTLDLQSARTPNRRPRGSAER